MNALPYLTATLCTLLFTAVHLRTLNAGGICEWRTKSRITMVAPMTAEYVATLAPQLLHGNNVPNRIDLSAIPVLTPGVYILRLMSSGIDVALPLVLL